MKTGLTKKQKVTEVYYNAKGPIAEVYTHDTKLKRRLLAYTIEGTPADSCRERSYPLEHFEILGYGIPIQS